MKIQSHHIFIVFWSLVSILIIVSLLYKWWKQRKQKELQVVHISIRFWWLMVGIFLIAVIIHSRLSVAFFGLISFLALKEFFTLIPNARAHRRVLFFAYLAIPTQFYWIYIKWYGMFIIYIPVYMFLLIPFMVSLTGDSHRFLRSVGSIHWGLMLMVFSISHISYLFILPPSSEVNYEGAGLLLYVLILTRVNDTAHFLIGRRWGRHSLASPQTKTWEGFTGGMIVTISMSYLLAPMLTPLNAIHSLFCGFILSIGGFMGAVNISSLKYDLGVKPEELIPGHGGVLSRLDSLMFNAPIFFHYMHYFYY
ncbi:phosphatidate cytidylyltransferase [Seinonella peptonophila]|uniref:Phosphatidate cytidylyltransferase n=1 Tax=Seinonella peptonophila TaxID=112248 RepID=A0A1M5AWH8_9BACL|nr:phosphatidate cytidylyltransferase [Seinonella peptonophila]SHF34292.1 phosphatidate cytidylyltransferase [Seinonella peptonophila]